METEYISGRSVRGMRFLSPAHDKARRLHARTDYKAGQGGPALQNSNPGHDKRIVSLRGGLLPV